MPIKLLALDLDGTIFDDNQQVSPAVRQAIADAQAAGVIVTIATGRMFRSARSIAHELNMDGPLICYQGALVMHSKTEQILLHKTVPAPLADEVIRRADEAGLHINVYMDDRLYLDKITTHAEYYARINNDLALDVVGDLRHWLQQQYPKEATKLVIITHPEQTDSVLAEYTDLFGTRLQVTKSHPRFTEFTNIECSKGRALAFLADHYGIKQEDVMAVGDGHNDLDMLQWAGYGIAMGNAPQFVQEAASHVCLPISQDGVAAAIEEHILAKRDT